MGRYIAQMDAQIAGLIDKVVFLHSDKSCRRTSEEDLPHSRGDRSDQWAPAQVAAPRRGVRRSSLSSTSAYLECLLPPAKTALEEQEEREGLTLSRTASSDKMKKDDASMKVAQLMERLNENSKQIEEKNEEVKRLRDQLRELRGEKSNIDIESIQLKVADDSESHLQKLELRVYEQQQLVVFEEGMPR